MGHTMKASSALEILCVCVLLKIWPKVSYVAGKSHAGPPAPLSLKTASHYVPQIALNSLCKPDRLWA